MESAESPSQSVTFNILKDCVAYQVIQTSKEKQEGIKSGTRSSRRGKRVEAEAENTEEDLAADLDEFVLYLTQEIYQALPENLKTDTAVGDFSLDELGVPPTFTETLTTYSLASSPDAASELFYSILNAFIDERKTQADIENIDDSVPPPGGWRSTRTEECEICHRTVPLTYHHLIPKSAHQKVLKRKWHPESRLNAVAWLCRPCHTAVHKTARCEDLAQNYYTVELLMENESLQRWAAYANRQRWGVRRG